jgi:ERF superfamily.
MIEKLIKVQAGLKAPKSQFNKFGGYNYRSQEDILEAVKPLLAENGLMLTISDSIERIEDRYYIKATCTVTDGERSISVTAYAREPLSKKGMDDSQITGAASSYARKYALNGLFLIDDTKDADAAHKHDNSDIVKDLTEALDKVKSISG